MTSSAIAADPLQSVSAWDETESMRSLTLPPADAYLMPGVLWGRIESAMTPAFWAAQCWYAESAGMFAPTRLAATIEREVAACLLGGYGMPAEVGWAAYVRLLELGLLDGTPTESELSVVLAQPLSVNGREVRYRFVSQKARYLAGTLQSLTEEPLEDFSSGRALRDRLVRCPGIGPKTASWVARNWLGADDVAILDVHVVRACIRVGVMPQGADPARNYRLLEDRFLAFAHALDVRPSILDGIIWRTMKDLGALRAA